MVGTWGPMAGTERGPMAGMRGCTECQGLELGEEDS